MRPRIDDRAIRIVRSAVPQFEPCYLDLLEIYGEDLTPGVVFTELAELVERLLDDDDELELVERCLAAVEKVAVTPGIDAVEVVGYSFLDALRPDLLERLDGYFGQATESLLAALGHGTAALSGETLSREDLADIEELVERGFLTAPRSEATEAL